MIIDKAVQSDFFVVVYILAGSLMFCLGYSSMKLRIAGSHNEPFVVNHDPIFVLEQLSTS